MIITSVPSFLPHIQFFTGSLHPLLTMYELSFSKLLMH